MLKPIAAATVLVGALALLAFVPTASAGTYCYMSPDWTFQYCCLYPDPSGNPGSAEYAATSIASVAGQTACIAPGNGYSTADYVVECVVNSNC